MNELVPSEFYLGQNYPNPFGKRTTIKYCVPIKCRVTITICTTDGAFVERLVDEEKLAGTYEVAWQPLDVTAGAYICRMTAGSYTDTKKMLKLPDEG